MPKIYFFTSEPIIFWADMTRDYVDLVEKSFDNKVNELAKKYDALKNKKRTEDVEWDLEIIASDSCYLDTEIKETFRESVTISLYTYLENRLNTICELLNNELKLKMKPKDFAGSSIIERGSKYFLYSTDINLIQDSKFLWNEINKFKKIRNIIVHCNGKVEVGDKDIRTYISRQNGITIQDDKINIEKIFVLDLIKLIERYFNVMEKNLIERFTNVTE